MKSALFGREKLGAELNTTSFCYLQLAKVQYVTEAWARLARVGEEDALQAAREVFQLHNCLPRVTARQRRPQPALRCRMPEQAPQAMS